MARLVGAMIILACLLGACGLRGDLARPAPLLGADRRAYEAQRAEEAAQAAEKAAAKAKAEQETQAKQAADAAAQTPNP